MKQKSVSLQTAENLARFFLRHPDVSAVYLFGSIAMWGDGDDCDLIIETAKTGLAFEFLKDLNRAVEMFQDIKQEYGQAGVLFPDQYEILKTIRKGIVFQLLKWRIWEGECRDLCWNGKYAKWNACFQGQPVRAKDAAALVNENYRSLDAFLFPIGWQTSRDVRTLLPNFSGRKPWSEFPFHTVVRWQARRYNPKIGTFDERSALSGQEESAYRRLKRYAKTAWTKNRKTELAELETRWSK